MNQNPFDELQTLLQELEYFAPRREEVMNTSIIYRSTSIDDIVDDSLQNTELDEVNEDYQETEINNLEDLQVLDFPLSKNGPVAAVDCGIVRLGETENGLVIALRAAIVINDEDNSRVNLFRSGPMYLHNIYKTRILYRMGEQLGKPDFFVEIDETDPENPRLTRVKSGVADDAHQYGDRFRNWLERLVQRIATTSIENGILLLDGALTLRTRDTPQIYLEDLARLAGSKGNAVIAVSKQSMLLILGKPIRFWLNDVQNRACYRMLTPFMRREGMERILGNSYVMRFSALGPTFRVDVKTVDGQSDVEAIGQFYNSVLMRGGYPDILVRAHAHSYFTSPNVIQLQAQTGATYSLRPQRDVPLTGIFAPFGGRFK